MYIVHNYMQT